MKIYETFAELQDSTQSLEGLALFCRENLYLYIVQDADYVATGDDVTFVNGRVGKASFVADAKYIKTTGGNVQDDLDSIIAGSLPTQANNQFKFLSTNGTGANWSIAAYEVATFAQLEALGPVSEGQSFICQERANARYILRELAYVAQAGDVTFANGRVGELQVGEQPSVLMFGVSADGVTDDYAIVQSACDRCSSLDIATGGTLLISQALEINNPGFKLTGSGLNPLTSDNAVTGGYDLYLQSSADTSVINVNAQGCIISEVSIYGNANNQTTQNTVAGIDIKATDTDVISVGMYKVAGKGITSSVQANGTKIEKCFIKNTGYQGVDMASMPDSACSNNTVLFAGVYGWRDGGVVSNGIQIGDTCRVWANSVFQTVGDNLYFIGKHSRAFGNRVDGPTRANARFAASSYQNTLSNNEMFDSGVYRTDDPAAPADSRSGVFDAGTLNTISNNYIGSFTKTYGTESWLGFQTYGVYLSGKKANVENNTIYDCKSAGVYINSDGNKVQKNEVKFCQLQGVVIAGDKNKVIKNSFEGNGFNDNDNAANIDVQGSNNVVSENYMLDTAINSPTTLTADWIDASSTIQVASTSGMEVGQPIFVVLDDTAKRVYPLIIGSLTATTITTAYQPRGAGTLASSGATVKTFLSWVGVKVRPSAADNTIVNNTYDGMFTGQVADSGTGTVNSGQTVI